MNNPTKSVTIEELKTDNGIFCRQTYTSTSQDCLVLVMGYGGSLRIWPATFVNRLAESFRVITYDNRGTGLSIIPQKPEEYTVKVMADDLFDVIDTLGINSHHLLGYSMGGCMALQYAHDHQDFVKSLFLLSSTAGGDLYAKPDRAISNALANPEGKTLWDIYMSTFSLMYAPEVLQRCMPTIEAIYEVSKECPTRPIALAGHSNAFRGFDGTSYLPGIKVPTTIVAGKNDRLMPVQNSMNIAENLSNSSLVLLDDCEHGPHIQNEDEIVDLIFKSAAKC
ncbi:MAG TPA: alpha/beta hydrolase [Candidatus Melainabacteria bacterium]|nr:alpha/beta hydrolase [Candidatus Melainabacteria bacterium]